MQQSYDDILSRIAEPPTWYDENGVPRYGTHHPSMAPSIYTKAVALVEIACQACLRRFLVQMISDLFTFDVDEFYALFRNGTAHYGDPPSHTHTSDGTIECISGNTMNCYDLRVVEFWSRDKGDWSRVPALEVELEGIKELRAEGRIDG